jgi:peptidoglycan LD-endopeptidase LytH
MKTRGFRQPAHSHRLTPACLLVLALAACAGNPPPAPGPPGAAGIGRLVIPVAGVDSHELRDSYHEPRSGGRQHRAIDIAAPRGTPVYAAADGTILRLHQGNLGGISIYQLDADGRTRYYYAHLFRYARGLREGQRVRRGEVIGYVGDTGNAGRGNYHLHFSVAILDDPRRWWEGTNLNPYPLLKEGIVKR